MFIKCNTHSFKFMLRGSRFGCLQKSTFFKGAIYTKIRSQYQKKNYGSTQRFEECVAYFKILNYP